MFKVKIFQDQNIEALEKKINDFVFLKNIVDIKISESDSISTILVIYK